MQTKPHKDVIQTKVGVYYALAGRNLFGDAQLGEYFRVFVAYGVIGVSLVMHAWRKQIEGRRRLSQQ